MKINTVTGPVDTAELGETLSHEHIICSGAEFMHFFPPWLPEETVLQIAAAKLKYAAKMYNIRTVIDGTPLTLGRNLELLKKVSEYSGVQIIASTGFYFYDSFPLLTVPAEKIAGYLTDEILNGSIKPAVFKCAADIQGITPAVDKIFQIAALVHKATAIPVYCHTHSGSKNGIAAQKKLIGYGVNPAKLVLGHVSDSNDLSYALELLKNGSFVSIDRIYEHNTAFTEKLITSGFEERIFLSHDHICCNDTVLTGVPQNEPYGLDIVHGRILPALLAAGIPPETLHKLTTTNIIDLFS